MISYMDFCLTIKDSVVGDCLWWLVCYFTLLFVSTMLDCLVVCILDGCLCHWLIVCTIVCDVPWVISRHTLLSSNSSLVAICLWLFPHWEWRWTVLRCQPYNSNPSILCHFFSEIQIIACWLVCIVCVYLRVELGLVFSTSHGEWYKDPIKQSLNL